MSRPCLAMTLLALLGGEARGQGCVVARQNARAEGDGTTLAPGSWQLACGLRWFRSDRHFSGSEEQSRADEARIVNDVSQLDLELSYAITRRFGAAVSLPYLVADRSEPVYRPDNVIVGRTRTSAHGPGDLVLSGRAWLLDPARSWPGNVALSVGVKLPTGAADARDSFRSYTGETEDRTVDPAILPGDGGVGLVLGVAAFWPVWKLDLFFSGSYLANPENTSGVPSGVPGEAAVLSVPDQYVARAGAFIGVPPVPGLAVGLGARLEGVRHIDLIGDSDGFRRAGYTFGVEPAAQLAVGDWAFSAGVPIAVLRRSYGDASFADYALLFGLTYRFGGHGHPPPAPPMTAHEPARSIADAELVTLDGRPTRLGEALAGRRLTIVNVWAGWCAPCREEMPMLKRLRPEIEARGGALVGVSVDDDADGARAFVAAMGIDFPSYHGGRALSEAIAEPTVPTTLFVDASGRVVFRVRGLLSEAALRSALDEHLGPPRPL